MKLVSDFRYIAEFLNVSAQSWVMF